MKLIQPWVPEPLAAWLVWMSLHQTLLAGFAAIGVGWLTVREIRRQINSENVARETERKRKLASRRAGLPIYLSIIHDYAEKSALYLMQFLDREGRLVEIDAFDEIFSEKQHQNFVVPDFPYKAFEILAEVVEHTDQEESSAIHEVIAYGQIQNSRLRTLQKSLQRERGGYVPLTINVLYGIRDAVGLLKHVDRMYGWARNNDADIMPMCSSEDAVNSTVLWRASEEVREHVKMYWPPDFPSKILKEAHHNV